MSTEKTPEFEVEEECDTCGVPASQHGAECAGYPNAPEAPKTEDAQCATCGREEAWHHGSMHGFRKPATEAPKTEEHEAGCNVLVVGKSCDCGDKPAPAQVAEKLHKHIGCGGCDQNQLDYLALRAELAAKDAEIAKLQKRNDSQAEDLCNWHRSHEENAMCQDDHQQVWFRSTSDKDCPMCLLRVTSYARLEVEEELHLKTFRRAEKAEGERDAALKRVERLKDLIVEEACGMPQHLCTCGLGNLCQEAEDILAARAKEKKA